VVATANKMKFQKSFEKKPGTAQSYWIGKIIKEL
jgi:hypothetical protein